MSVAISVIVLSDKIVYFLLFTAWESGFLLFTQF